MARQSTDKQSKEEECLTPNSLNGHQKKLTLYDQICLGKNNEKEKQRIYSVDNR